MAVNYYGLKLQADCCWAGCRWYVFPLVCDSLPGDGWYVLVIDGMHCIKMVCVSGEIDVIFFLGCDGIAGNGVDFFFNMPAYW